MRLAADTNVLLRAVVGDDPVQSPAAASALRSASLVAISSVALVEFVWVLSRVYKRPNDQISAAIRTLIAADNVKVDRASTESGLAFMDAGGDFADGVIASQGTQLGADVFVSFDFEALRIAQGQRRRAAMP